LTPRNAGHLRSSLTTTMMTACIPLRQQSRARLLGTLVLSRDWRISGGRHAGCRSSRHERCFAVRKSSLVDLISAGV
jgi:hypothetical protein